MSRCLLRVDNETAAGDIDAARRAADSPESVDDYRTAMLDAMAARDGGQDPAAVLRGLWRGAYIAGHLDGAGSRRAGVERAELESAVLGGILEPAGGGR